MNQPPEEQHFQPAYQQGTAESGRSGPPWTLIGLIIVVVLAVIFVLTNREETTIDFLFFDVQSRVWTAIAISIGIGIVLDRFILAWWRRARKRKRQQND